MYGEIPLWVSIAFVAGGLAALAWSSDLFVDGAAAMARSLGISSFVVGMVVIGFGTSAPELCVSTMSGFSGHSNLSLGNAYGSCVFNIAAILGVAALIRPVVVKKATACVAVPVLAAIAVCSWFMLRDGECSRFDGALLLASFLVLLPLYCWFDQKVSGGGGDGAAGEKGKVSIPLALLKVVAGLFVLIGSSHFLVWGAVDMARALGVGELTIGLTIVAAGTSLPELASAVASARRGENEFILGNIIGSNFFNSLAVVGLAASISPAAGFSSAIISRDLPAMAALSISIALFGVNWRRPREDGSIGRISGLVWLAVFAAYMYAVVSGARSGG
ncbi:MAG: calcium/sodium antiporter [Kiritimatiellae bacterium]|nr:calcium/sodium antiporter [Kiritimatiellia bacterium]